MNPATEETRANPKIQSVRFLDIRFDLLTIGEAASYLESEDGSSHFGYVVTPNVDHVVRLNAREADGLRKAYETCALSLCDSRILRALARFTGLRLPLVPGSDLTENIFQHVLNPGDRIGVVGMDPAGMTKLRGLYPDLKIDHIEPPFGFLDKPEEVKRIVSFVEAKRRRFYFFAVGSPRSEIVVHKLAERGHATGLAICCGASLLFLTGDVRRAPRIMQRLHLEWLFRLMAEPKRLAGRYLIQGPKILVIYGRWLLNGRST